MLEAHVEPETLLWPILENITCHHGATRSSHDHIDFRLIRLLKIYILIWNFLICGPNNEYD